VVQCAITESSLTQTGADAAVVALHKHEDRIRVQAEPDAVPDDVRQSLEHLFTAVSASTALGDTTVVPSPAPLPAGVVIGVGLGGPRPDLAESEVLRRAAGAAARAGRSFASLALALPATDQAEAAAVLEGAILGGYSFDAFRTTTAKPTETTSITVLAAGIDGEVAHVVERAAAVNLCRDLVNTPPGDLRPSAFTERVAAAGRAAGIEVSVIEADQLRSEASGGILAVGQGSSDPPRLIKMTYAPVGAQAHLALVGKGITFDSGGLSLKPPKSMETMKCDMSGAAAVASALVAIAAEGLPVRVTGWLAVAENMPSGTAQRPGDVIAMYGGKTVEVLNTDAEGRLVMGDALVRAAREQPDALLDIATLTGAQMVALGMTTAGVMGNNAGLRDGICAVGREAGEALWPMPLPPELRPSLDSPVADIANIGDRSNGGMLTAGLFLQEFVPEGVPWGHLDIAGPAFNTAGASGYTPKGGTGFGVRTLVAVARAMAEGSLRL
jgi:leucyl aminopeptidase